MACQEKVVCDQVQGCQLKERLPQEQADLPLQNQLPAHDAAWASWEILDIPISKAPGFQRFSCLSYLSPWELFSFCRPGWGQQSLASNFRWREEKRGPHPEQGRACALGRGPGVPLGSRGVGGSHLVRPRCGEGPGPSCPSLL